MAYVLGRNVTEQARAKEARGTVVLSFRITARDFDTISDLALKMDRTISQVARMALRVGLTDTTVRGVAFADTAGNPATWTKDD